MRARYDLSNALSKALLLIVLCAPAIAAAVPYDIVYVRQPRFGDNTNTTWPEVAHPASLDPGADLMLLHPDGREEMLVQGGVGAVTDPFVSFDGQWVYYTLFYDVRPQAINSQRGLPYLGADIFRIHLTTREIQQLTFQEFTPNTGAGHFDESNPVNPGPQYDRLGYGILNLGPAPVAGGKIAFSSNRNGFVPPRGLTNPTLQLYVMDADGGNVTQIAPMNIGSALHPTPLRDGRLLFSTLESQGLRDGRMWGIWSIWPDGRHWEPVVSAFRSAQAFHFMTQLSSTDLVVVDYYNLNNNGFGALYRLPSAPPPTTPRFHSPYADENPPIDQTVGGGFRYPFQMSFTPYGLRSITPFTHGNDEAAPVGAGGARVGKFTHPSGAPNNDLLVVWSPGPCNDLNRPTTLPYYDAGIYLIPGGDTVTGPNQLVLIKNSPSYNEAWPRAVVPYAAVHGVPEPTELPWLPNDGTLHPELPAGTPYGLVGTSSVYKRESFPGFVSPWSDTFDGLDALNTYENGQSSNWEWQGADAGKYDDADIWAVRIVGMEPNTHRSYGPHGGPSGGSLFTSHAEEKLRILGEIPLRKQGAGGQPLLDPEGNPDTSFLVKLPADTPFTFQTLDRNGMVLNMAQTWHQVRPGEVRNDCGGCHAHSQAPLDFASTAAARPGYLVADLSKTTPLLSREAQGNPTQIIVNAPMVTVEFLRDVRPILQRSCVPCHTKSDPNPPGDLVLDDYTSPDGRVPGDYARLAADQDARWGYPPLVSYGWRQTNASRYVRMFQSRRSLLMWKIFGRRLDGWTNADHPTESVPGDESTLPPGADVNTADLDFTGLMMPPPGSGVPPLSEDEKLLFARWIDLGAPINWGGNGATAYGWFLDDLRPSLDVSLPRPGGNDGPLALIRFGAADAHTGVDWSTLSVRADFIVNGRAPGAELADVARSAGDGIYEIALSPALGNLPAGELMVAIEDRQGNVARVARRFAVRNAAAATATPTATRPLSTVPPSATSTAIATATRTAATPTPSASATASAQGGTPITVSGSVRYYAGDRAVGGVSVGGTSTDARGAFTATGGAGADFALRPQRSGSVDGAVSALDAAYVLQAIANRRSLDARQSAACDVTANGSLSALDATRILQFAVGMPVRLDAAVACASDWIFFPEAAPAPNQRAAAPALHAGACEPGAVWFAPLAQAAAGQNFSTAVIGDCTGNWTADGPAARRRTAAARVRASFGKARRAGGELRLPLRLRAGEAIAVEVAVRADPQRLRFINARLRDGAARALLYGTSEPDGAIRIAVAGAESLGAFAIALSFETVARDATARDVRIEAVRLNEREAAVRP
ncbi:MAG: dockerin type I domain-containing protein [Candidatus Binatia bacterium]